MAEHSTKKRRELPPAPEPLPVPVVDNHTHLDHNRADSDGLSVDAAIAAAAQVGVTQFVQIGCELESARWTVQAVDQYPEMLGGVALHPTEASSHYRHGGQAELESALAETEQLAAHPRIRVIGETGLDYYWIDADATAERQAQRDSFAWHIDLAKRTGKALQIHDRDAHDDILDVLRAEGAPEKTVFHCFSGDAEMARYCAEQGWVLSFAGTVTFKNAAHLREALALVPEGQIQVETDAPYLTPHPHRGAPNASFVMPLTVRAMAEVRGVDVAQLCVTLRETAMRLYGPW